MSRPSYDELLQENQALRLRVVALEAQVETLAEQNERLVQQNQELAQKLEGALRKGKRQAGPFSRGKPKLEPKKPGRKRGKDYGQKGQRPPPDHIDEYHEAELPAACPQCGSTQIEECEIVHQYQTEIPRQPIYHQFNIPVGKCQQCGARVQGRHPLQTSDATGAAASQLGPEAQAAVVNLNKEAGLSHGKVSKVFGELFGIDLTRGGSAHTVLRVAKRLLPDYENIGVHIAEKEDRLWINETGWRIGGHSAWLHVWVGEEATRYHIDPRRSADALEELLGLDWDGTLHHDGLRSYDRFASADHQQCCAHVMRRAKELLKGAVGGAVHFPREVLQLFDDGLAARREHLEGRLAEEKLEEVRMDLEDRLTHLVLPPRAVPEYQRLSNHLFNHFDEWFTFVTDPACEPTNNRAERAIRPAVVNRKVWGSNRTEAGAQTQSILASVLETCKQQAQKTIDYISQKLRGVPVFLFGTSR